MSGQEVAIKNMESVTGFSTAAIIIFKNISYNPYKQYKLIPELSGF